MTPIQQMILAVITSSLATGGLFKFVEFLISRRDAKHGKTAKLCDDMTEIKSDLKRITTEVQELHEDDLTIMHDRIYQAFVHMEDMTEISTDDRTNIDYLFERYTKRGGNHKAELMYDQIKKKPVVDKYKTRSGI